MRHPYSLADFVLRRISPANRLNYLDLTSLLSSGV